MKRPDNQERSAIVVTGALGHIGSRLIRELASSTEGPIILIDNFSTQRYASLFDLPTDGVYEFIQGDICDMNFDAVLKRARVLVHLAARTDAESSVTQSEEVERVNAFGLRCVADACLAHGVPMLFPSTTSVYGTQAQRVDEQCAELQPQSPYAATKLSGEEYLRSLHTRGLRMVICRFGTIFGWSIGMRFHTAVNKFIWQAAYGEPLTVWKTAWEQQRPYLDLSDAVRAIQHIIDTDMFDGETYNVVTRNFTVREVVEAIQQLIPNTQITFVDSKIMNQLSYEVDSSKFERMGFMPNGNLGRGIADTLTHLSGKYTAT